MKGLGYENVVVAESGEEHKEEETREVEQQNRDSRLAGDGILKGHGRQRLEYGSTDLPNQPGAIAVDGPAAMEEESTITEEVTVPSPNHQESEHGASFALQDVESQTVPVDDSTRQTMDTTCSTLPIAEEYREPIITAELVKPPESATVYRVDIDGEEGQSNDFTLKTKEKEPKKANRSSTVLWFAVCVAVVLIAVVVMVLVGAADSSIDTASDDAKFDYKCYNSTLDLLTAQIEAEKDLPMEPLIICPDTIIQIGTFRNPSRNDYNYTNGDWSISAIRPNVTIQCGLDGKRSNNCTISGGLAHIVNQNIVYHPTYGFQESAPRVDNFLVKGLTFTGSTQASGIFGGLPVALSHPGSTRFEDCAWINLTTTKRVIVVGQNYLLELQGIKVPDMSIDLTISNCLFDNVIYEEEFLLNIFQTLHVEDTVFRNIQLPELLPRGCYIHPNGCRNLMHCRTGGPGACSIRNICVENFDVTGAGPILIGDQVEWSMSGVNTWNGPEEYAMLPSSVENTNKNFTDEAGSEVTVPTPDGGAELPKDIAFDPVQGNQPETEPWPEVAETEIDEGEVTLSTPEGGTEFPQDVAFNPVQGNQPEIEPLPEGSKTSEMVPIGGLNPIDGEPGSIDNPPFCVLGVARMINGSSDYFCMEELAFVLSSSDSCFGRV